jgi:integrase
MKIFKKLTINDVIPQYLNKVQSRTKDGTTRFYRQYAEYVAKYLGHKDLESINEDDITFMINSKRKENPDISNNTLNKYLVTLQQIYKYATNKTLDVQKLKVKKKEMKIVSKQSIDKILNYLSKNRYKKVDFFYEIFFRILMDTGIRLNEIRHLKIENIDMISPKIKVEVTKTDTDRTVYLSNETHELLKLYVLQHDRESDFLFPGHKGEIISEGAIYSKINSLKKTLGITEEFRPHSWRHTFATGWIDDGGSLPFLQKILGHSKLETTEKYLHFDDSRQLAAYQEIMNKRKAYS